MFNRKVENVIMETSEQFTERLKKETDQGLKITAVDFALKLSNGIYEEDRCKILIDSAQKIYDFISK